MRDQSANDVAQWTTGLLEQMEELTGDMIKELKKLDMSSEAGTYGRATIQAFASGIDAMAPKARAAALRVVSEVNGVLATAMGSGGAYTYIGDEMFSIGAAPYHNAAGTDNAPPGWLWVGEEGPELIRLHGGEQIIPAGASRQLAEDYAAYSRYTAAAQGVQPARALEVVETETTGTTVGKVEMHFHIGAGAAPETVDAWEEFARRGELKATILEVMEDADADMRRRVLR